MKSKLRKFIKLICASPWIILNLRWSKNFSEFPTINGICKFTKNTYIGKNCHFNGLKIEGNGRVFIGDNFHSGKECIFITDIHNYDMGSELPYGSDYIIREIVIKDNVWIGTRVLILGGVTLGEGCIIQAGSVVTKSIPPLAIAGGAPAKVFKYRNHEHYYSKCSSKS